jgi:hypothetical protein
VRLGAPVDGPAGRLGIVDLMRDALVRLPDQATAGMPVSAAPEPLLRSLVRLSDHVGREPNHLDRADRGVEPAVRPCVPAITSLHDAPGARDTGTPTWSCP